MKTNVLNMRLDPFFEEIMKRCMKKEKKSKTDVTKAALLLYAKDKIGLEELMKIRLEQDFGVDAKKIKITDL